jgi:carboxypeptidase Q
MKKIILATLFLFTIQLSFAQQENSNYSTDSITIKKMVDNVMSNSIEYENLRFLCKKIGARLSGSDNAAKAILATKKMLEEAGADTVYLQPCMVSHWVRGAKEEGYCMVDGKKINLHLTSLGNTNGTNGKMINATVVEVKTMKELHKLGKSVKGKIVFFNIPMNPTYIRTFKAYGEAGIGRRSGPTEASRYGAIGVLVRSLASNVDDYPHTGATWQNDSFPKIPSVAISTNDANKLSIALKTAKNAKAFFKNSCAVLPKVPSYNVIGEIRGTEKPEEIITVGGHLDSWDLAEGAQDDGAGIVQSIEVIRVLKATGTRPKRTIRAVMFMDEENGGGGSEAYLENAKTKKENHIFALESDAGGFTPRGFQMDMSEQRKLKIKSWAALFLPYGVYDFSETGSGADIEELYKVGAGLAELMPDSNRYFDLHHAATDVFESVSKRELDLGAANMAALIWLVSEYGL